METIQLFYSKTGSKSLPTIDKGDTCAKHEQNTPHTPVRIVIGEA